MFFFKLRVITIFYHEDQRKSIWFDLKLQKALLSHYGSRNALQQRTYLQIGQNKGNHKFCYSTNSM